MNDFQTDVIYRMVFGLGLGLTVVGLLSIGPWIFAGGLLAVGIFGGRWWAKKGRFKNLQLAQRKMFFDTRDLIDIESFSFMYLGTTAEGTIRWWYTGGDYMIPQAIDNGEVYWEKRVEIRNATLLKHLRGFYEMGNEWPEYYKTVVAPQEKPEQKKKKSRAERARELSMLRKGKIIEAVPSDLPRADYTDGELDAKPMTAAAAADRPMMELIQAVESLEKDVKGTCPTIDFEGCRT